MHPQLVRKQIRPRSRAKQGSTVWQQTLLTPQDVATEADKAAAGGCDEDADFVLDEWDSDGGQPGSKRSSAALRCTVADSTAQLC